jgi:hypothetical protein
VLSGYLERSGAGTTPVFEAATIVRQHPFADFNQQVLQSINYDPEKIQQLESITYGLSTGAFL